LMEELNPLSIRSRQIRVCPIRPAHGLTFRGDNSRFGRRRDLAGCGKTHVLYQGTTLQLAEKVLLRRGIVPPRLKPDSLQGIYVRPEGRTLQRK
jgi:hypothetical protein